MDKRSESKPKDDNPFLRPSKLRSSLRSKVTSLFGRRPQSCHLERFDINQRSAEVMASSQSLFAPFGAPSGSPSLDAFLSNVIKESGSNPDIAPHMTTLVNSSGFVSFDPKQSGPNLRHPTESHVGRRRPVSIAGCYSQQDIFPPKELAKPKELKSFLKKAATKRKDKISASISSFTNKIREHRLSRRDLTSVGQGSYPGEYTFEDSRYLPGKSHFERQRRNTITGIEESPCKKYAWSHQTSTFCSFPEKPDEENDTGYSSEVCRPSSRAETPLRHMDSSSEEDLLGLSREPGTNGSNHGLKTIPFCPFSPFTRSKSEFLDISRVRAARYNFLTKQEKLKNETDNNQSTEPIYSNTLSGLPPPVEVSDLPPQVEVSDLSPPVEVSVETQNSLTESVLADDTPSIADDTKEGSSDIEVLLDEGFGPVGHDAQLPRVRQSVSKHSIVMELEDIIRYVQKPIRQSDEHPPATDSRKMASGNNNNYKRLMRIHEGFHPSADRTKSLLSLASCDPVDLTVPLRKVKSFPNIADHSHCVPMIPDTSPTVDTPKKAGSEDFDSVSVSEDLRETHSMDIPTEFPLNSQPHKLPDLGSGTIPTTEMVTSERVIPCHPKLTKQTKKNQNKHRRKKAQQQQNAQKTELERTRESETQRITKKKYQRTKRARRRSKSRNTQKRNASSMIVEHSRGETKGRIDSVNLQPKVKQTTKPLHINCKKEGSTASDLQLVYLNTLLNNEHVLKCHKSEGVDSVVNERDVDIINDDKLVLPETSTNNSERLVDQLQRVYNEHPERACEAIRWALTEGEQSLLKLQEPLNTLTGINGQLANFNDFFFYAKTQVDKGLILLEKPLARTTPDTGVSAQSADDEGHDLTKTLTKHLESFTDKLNLTKDRLEDTAKCYLLLDKAYEWALQAMKVVSALKASGVASPEQVGAAAKTIGSHMEENPPVPDDAFEAMVTLATKLNNQTLLQQCKNAQSRCKETIALLRTRHSALLKARRQMEFDCQSFVDLQEVMGGPEEQSPFSWLSNSSLNNSGRRKSVTSLSSRPRDPLSRCSSFDTDEESLCMEPQYSSTPKATLEARASLGGIKELRESAEDLHTASRTNSIRSGTSAVSSPMTVRPLQTYSSGSSTCSSSDSSGSGAGRKSHKTHSWKYHQSVSQTNEDCPDSLSEESLSPLSSLSPKSIPPSAANSHLLIRGSQINLSNCEDLTEEEAKRNKRLLLITQELIQTERDYVRSLEFIIENYIPELLREDIPQALRGQRNVIFGNLEKIFEFHSGYFLEELEACQNNPFNVGSIFLNHEKQFYLYALYNKNKPKSDGLMSEYGSLFFRTKQMQLGDKMDLSSYLLKPVQRMGKYALLLKQLLKECARGEEGVEELTAAQEMVQFQLRHGNDLLAMDSLRDCDVNLKEQGRLLRQGELLVAEGNRKKSIRHVFLFEDMILFSKSRRDPEKKTLDIFQYKYSMKMTDIGLTEQIGDSPLRFEIWFRKRKPSDTYILQAPNLDMKETWTVEISKLLWRQALKNRTMRLHEMSSMGIGNKPCLDIRPSEDQIRNRSVRMHSQSKARLRATTSSPTELTATRRPNSVISVSSSASSGASSSQSSATGPTFVGTLNLGFEPGDSPRPLQRSVTRTSQCSAESGIQPDIYSDKELVEGDIKVERSNSTVTTASVDSGLAPAPVSAYVPVMSLSRIAREGTCEVKQRISRSLLTTEV